ncbi:MAG: PAAR domain-containing protein [Deferribacteres bacterium]|nr:PAAR domain-containing protein [Deferribacteres bacterium]
MPAAARVGDLSTHGGTIVGPGVPTVLIGKMPAAVATDNHVCPIPPPGHVPTVSIFPVGSTTVLIGGKPALRTSDLCICGAASVIGEPTVVIGG